MPTGTLDTDCLIDLGTWAEDVNPAGVLCARKKDYYNPTLAHEYWHVIMHGTRGMLSSEFHPATVVHDTKCKKKRSPAFSVFIHRKGRRTNPLLATRAAADIERLTYLVPLRKHEPPFHDPFLEKHLAHLEYLARVSTGPNPPITAETAKNAKIAWLAIRKASHGRVPVPSAGTGPDGEMFYAWKNGRYHLELEIIPGQPAEFFYSDRETGEFWGEDFEVGTPLPPSIVSKLTLFQ
jgi:hypothetical protein